MEGGGRGSRLRVRVDLTVPSLPRASRAPGRLVPLPARAVGVASRSSRLLLDRLECAAWNHGAISRDEAEERLMAAGGSDGMFLVRTRDTADMVVASSHTAPVECFVVTVSYCRRHRHRPPPAARAAGCPDRYPRLASGRLAGTPASGFLRPRQTRRCPAGRCP